MTGTLHALRQIAAPPTNADWTKHMGRTISTQSHEDWARDANERVFSRWPATGNDLARLNPNEYFPAAGNSKTNLGSGQSLRNVTEEESNQRLMKHMQRAHQPTPARWQDVPATDSYIVPPAPNEAPMAVDVLDSDSLPLRQTIWAPHAGRNLLLKMGAGGVAVGLVVWAAGYFLGVM